MVTADETVIASSECFEVRSGPKSWGVCSTGQVDRGVLGVGRSGRIKQSRNGLSAVLETWVEEVEGICEAVSVVTCFRGGSSTQ